MTQSEIFALVGGDRRFLRVANSLADEGYCVKVYGMCDKCGERVKESTSLSEVIEEAKTVILPLPSVTDEMIINMCDERISLEELLGLMRSDQLILGGKLSWEAKEMITRYGIEYADYFEDEALTVMNAMLTAEGAIWTAMNELETSVISRNYLIVGFGRIGKFLAKMLSSMGAKVRVATRRAESLAWIEGYGYDGCDINNLEKEVFKSDVVFNTVPHCIIDENIIKKMKRDTLIIDLASKPGGVDMEAAMRHNIKTVWALALPGKYAPTSAGDIIKNTIINILNEMEV